MRGKAYEGEPCPHYPDIYNTEAAHQAHLAAKRRSQQRIASENEPKQFEAEAYPLRLRLQRILNTIKWRCRVRPRYAGRGITCELTLDDMAILWVRDNADQLHRPSIDRIDNDGSYTRENCRFIEFAENVRRGVRVRDEEKSRTPTPAQTEA